MSETADREIVISRIIEGPRRLVFQAFTDARHLDAWWGPNGFTNETRSFEFREGGEWDYVMHGPDGTDYDNWIKWRRIVEPERLEYLHGERPDDPDAFDGSMTFVDHGERTEVILRTLFPTKEARDHAVQEFHAIEGGEQTLGRLAEFVASHSALDR